MVVSIRARDDWEFVGEGTSRGITGRNTACAEISPPLGGVDSEVRLSGQ